MPAQNINQQRIGFIAGTILIAATLVVSIAVFFVMQRFAERLLSKNLQLSLETRVQLLQSEIGAGFNSTEIIATRPLLINQIQRANTDGDAGAVHQTLNQAAQSLLSTGLLGIALYDQNGNELAHAGSITRAPQLKVPLNLPGRVHLAWDGRLLLDAAIEMKRSGHVVGTVVTEMPLPITTKAFMDASILGKTAELVLCAPLGTKMACFPSILNPHVMTLSFRSSEGNLLPMAHALAGKTGFINTYDYRHHEVVAAYAPVSSLGLGMVLKMDGADLFAPLWRQLRYVIPLLIGVFIVALLSLRGLMTPLVSRLVRSEAEASRRNATLAREIAEHRQAEAKVLRFKHALDNTLDMIFMFAPETLRFVYLNQGAVLSTGYSQDELLKMTPWEINPLLSEPQFRQLIAPLLSGESSSLNFESVHRHKDGTPFPVDVVLQLIAEPGESSLFVAIVRDISERKQFEARLVHQATHDALTGLPNRTLFSDTLAQAMVRAQRTEKLLAVMFLDLDEFKNINDTLGHDCGDVLLKEIARRLTATLRRDDLVARGDDLVARQGGDEFTILLQGVSNVHDITQVASKILTAVAEPFMTGDHEIHVTASIGITVFPFDDTDIEHLLRNADTAMFRAKDNGRNNFEFYTAAMNAFIRERMEIENGLHHALANGEFVLHYQPQVDLGTGNIIAVEALVRWMHPEKGMIAPDRFIPIAEESGLIVAIGEWVLRTACRQNKTWQDNGFPPIRMAINLSGRQFRDSGLLATVSKALGEANLNPRSGTLELEVTESMVMKDIEGTIKTLNELHKMGLHLSIDDFGTGYSSLSHLKRFPINTLKIDQSFVRDITADPDDAIITATIVALGHSLKLNVIAEGVETAEQLAFLREIKCDQIQGYYFSRPLPAEELEVLLREGRRLN